MKVKSYKNVVRGESDISFSIKSLEDVYAVTKGVPDEPHRHDYYTIILLLDGEGKHTIDFHTFDLAPLQAYFISPGQIHQLAEEKMSSGYVLTFSSDFLALNDIDKQFINDLHIFLLDGNSPPLHLTVALAAKLSEYCEDMSAELSQRSKHSYVTIGLLLKLFLIKCHQECSISPTDHLGSSPNILLRDFKALLDTNFSNWHKVKEYANALYVTADHLNATVVQLTGQNVKAHIQNAIILKAKRELLYSGKTTKEIAYELGFKEASHFSQFFKKCVGLSPSAFVKQA